MLAYLLDTDVVSKKDGPNGANIRSWWATVDDNRLALSALTLFEMSRGIQKKRDDGDAATADALQTSLEVLKAAFEGRILPVDAAMAEVWGATAGSDRRQWMDRGLIATAKAHGLILVTCNAKDIKGRGVEVIDPERKPPGHWDPDGAAL